MFLTCLKRFWKSSTPLVVIPTRARAGLQEDRTVWKTVGYDPEWRFIELPASRPRLRRKRSASGPPQSCRPELFPVQSEQRQSELTLIWDALVTAFPDPTPCKCCLDPNEFLALSDCNNGSHCSV